MEEVLNIEKCKICGGLIRIERNENEITKVCTCCGYFYNKKNNFEGKITDEVKEIEYLNPCGAYMLTTISGVGQIGTLGENRTMEEVLNKFNFSNTSRLDMNKTYINYKDKETNEFKIIFGKGKPESYEEFIKSLGM